MAAIRTARASVANKRVFIEAIRTIQPGDELAYDYQIQRDDDDAPNVDEIFACRCGAPSCRGSMLEPRKSRERQAAPRGKGAPQASAKRTERAPAAQEIRAPWTLRTAARRRPSDRGFARRGDRGPRRIPPILRVARARRVRRDAARARRFRGGAHRRRPHAPAPRRTSAAIRSAGWRTPLFDPGERLLATLERLRLELNRGAIPGLFDLELHYAWYPAGAGYARHVDQPQNRDARVISLVLYLNEDWAAGDGGALRCFDAVRPPRDIEPIGGRLVAFLTEAREHAVLPARRPRLSLTGWFRSREQLPLR